MKDLLTRLARARFPYDPLITITLSKNNLLHNLTSFEKLAPGGHVAPVLKSNAYGHGLVEVAKILDETAVPFVVVDSYFEAIVLRTHRIRKPILVIGYTPPETIAHARLKDISFTVTSLDALSKLTKISAPKNKIHVKIDTGMRRQGILPTEIGETIELLKSRPPLVLEGICSHLAEAYSVDEKFTNKQITTWNEAARKFRETFPNLKYAHLSNTDGHRYTEDIDSNVSRLGIGLYGILEPGEIATKVDLEPVLSMQTIITGTKILKRGEATGYSLTFQAPNDMTIATIPVGYYEGIDRRLSNKGIVLVGDELIPCPIIGRVSMNISTIDISKVKKAEIGTRVVVISNKTTDPNSIMNIAQSIGVITYESTVRLPAHLKRIVV